ncbi:MAG: ParA family protein [Gammaproteobacteria bacterium]|nr:ParA family protein [Gammaproteobacteria bacterium]
MCTIAVINQKGGVGKTTTCVNLAHAIAHEGYRVLAIDLDPQGHLTVALGGDAAAPGVDRVLLEDAAMAPVGREVRPNIMLVGTGPRLARVEHAKHGDPNRAKLLQRALAGVSKDYDYIIIDCPPSSGLLAVNALLAADEVLIPVVGDYLTVQGLGRFLKMLKRLEEAFDRRIRAWFTFTRFHHDRRLALEVRRRVMERFPARVLEPPIRESETLAECPTQGKSIFEYRESSEGAEDYRLLARNFLAAVTP